MVSVVLPVYNTEKYLRRCMDALVSQTIGLSDLEIIAVNDGSTDGSLSILEEYRDRYPETIRIISKTNGGQASARNLGIQEARGEYIGFADSDDYVDVTMYEKMYNLAKESGADLVECHYHSMLETGIDDKGDPTYKEIGTRGHIRACSDPKELILDPQVSPWNKLYKKEVLKEGNITFPEGMIYEDTAFYIKTIPYIHKQAYLDEKLVYYSVRQGSTMLGNSGRKVGDIIRVFEDILDFYHRKGIYNEYKDELEYFCVKIAFCSNFSRIGRVKEPLTRRDLYNATFTFVQKNFPLYRKNKYFRGKTGMYIKSVNRLDCDLYGRVLSKVMVG